MTVEEILSVLTGISKFHLSGIIQNAPHSYKTFNIPKKNGGVRTVRQPSRQLKAVQRIIVEVFISKLPVHSAVMSYKKSISIKENASTHAMHNFILKMDFSNFFESIRISDVEHLLYVSRQYLPEDTADDDIKKIARICTFFDKEINQLRLAIGAPSSPSIANAILYEFDTVVADFCAGNNVAYTRYADDIVFSTNTPNILRKVECFVVDLIGKTPSPRISVNQQKTLHSSKKHKRVITGLIITPQGGVSVGRDKIREVRSLIYQYKVGTLSREKIPHLSGLVSYLSSIDNNFIGKMEKKYGQDTINQIRMGQSKKSNVA